MPSTDDLDGVWRRHAAHWTRVGPPLRPADADGAVIEAVARAFSRPEVLVLGVTPEMARLRWPAGTQLLAIDREPEMVARVWPGFPGPGEGARLADWLCADLPPRSRDLVVSDGCFGVLRFPEEAEALMRVVGEVLRPEGRFVFRVFVRPDVPEPVAAVFAAAMAGECANFHSFKLRLLMAVQGEAAGVCTGAVWEVWAATAPPSAELAARTGWPVAQIATIEAYRGQATMYAFPRLEALVARLGDAGFEVLQAIPGAYPLGERCPTLVCAHARARRGPA